LGRNAKILLYFYELELYSVGTRTGRGERGLLFYEGPQVTFDLL
jgi:hypothetical protein